MTENATRRVCLLIVDEGSYHEQVVTLAQAVLDRYERLIDALREDPEVLKTLYVDVARLAGAWVVEDEP